MKVCENCTTEIDGKDGDNLCPRCEEADGGYFDDMVREALRNWLDMAQRDTARMCADAKSAINQMNMVQS